VKKEKLNFDEIQYWSEVKLDIIRDYASEYSKILSRQSQIKEHVYIDGFAGAGIHLSKLSGETIPGSPINALNIDPPFKKYYLIDLKQSRTQNLISLAKNHQNVHVYPGDCNKILLQDVFPKVKFEDFRRGLCLLDPYGLHLDWKVIETAGEMKTIEIFLNFPIMDMNQNILWHQPEKVTAKQIQRMNFYWGDESWKTAVYEKDLNLFNLDWLKKEADSNGKIAFAFKERLKKVARFSYVLDPIPMRNSKGATVYYLFFASPNSTGVKIVKHIFDKYKDKGAGQNG
jgi:three-Cys-motif partner protein